MTESPESRVVLISGDGAFLAGGLSIEAAFANELEHGRKA